MLYGKGSEWGIIFRDFTPTESRLHSKNGARWSVNEASKGGGICHAMTSGESSKPCGGAYKIIITSQSGPMGPT